MRRRKKRIVLITLILITASLGYYFTEYNFDKKVEDILKSASRENQTMFENQSPDEIILILQEKIDTLNNKIQLQDKIIPFYSSPIQVYDKIIQTLNLLDQKTELNIDKHSTENLDDFRVERFQIKGESKFTDLFHLINLFETSPELYKIHLKEIKQTFTTNNQGRMEERVLFNLILETFYTTNEKYSFVSTLSRKNLRTVFYTSDFFASLIKMDVPPNDAGLFEVDGAKLLAIMPDAIYLIDKKGNSITLTEGDEVYLGYLTKIDYQNHSCEFLLNKGGILERVTLKLDDKEDVR